MTRLLVWSKHREDGLKWLLPTARVEEVTDELNGIPSAKVSYDPLGKNTEQILLGERELEIWDGDNILFVGPMNDKDGNSARLTVTADGLMDHFKYRFVLQDNLEFEDVEQMNIAAFLIEYGQDDTKQGTNSDVGVTVAGFTPSGITQNKTYISERKHNLFEALSEFPTLEEGFDHAIIPQNNGLRLWTPFFPKRGDEKDLLLQYGKEIIDYTYKESYRKRATKVAATGGVAEQVDGERQKQEYTHEDLLASEKYGVSVAVLPSGSRADLPWLEARAKGAVNARKAPVVVPEIVVDNSKANIRSLIQVGDSIRVRIDHGSVQVAGQYRIHKITWTPTNDQLRLTFMESAG